MNMADTLAAMVRQSAKLAQPLAQGYAEGNMTFVVRVSRPGAPVFDRTSGRTRPGPPVVAYRGKAHVGALTGGQSYALGEEQAYFDSTTVSIPLGNQVLVNDDVEILAGPESDLVGKHFRVIGLGRGGMIPAAISLSVQGTEPSPNQPDR